MNNRVISGILGEVAVEAKPAVVESLVLQRVGDDQQPTEEYVATKDSQGWCFTSESGEIWKDKHYPSFHDLVDAATKYGGIAYRFAEPS